MRSTLDAGEELRHDGNECCTVVIILREDQISTPPSYLTGLMASAGQADITL